MSFLHADAGARELGVLRIAVFAVWFLVLWRLPFAHLAALPPELVEAPGVMSWLGIENVLQSSTVMTTIKLIALAGCLACALGAPGYRWFAPATWAAILMLDAAMKSVGGFMNHAQFGPLYVALIVALAPAADAVTPWHRSGGKGGRTGGSPSAESSWRYIVPLQAAALVLTAAYAVLGIRRLARGGVELYLDGSLDLWLVARSAEYSAYSFEAGLVVIELPGLSFLFAAGFATATLFEAGSPLALRFRWFRWPWLVVVGGLHLVTLVTMNIFFWENLLLVLLLFSGLIRVLAKPRKGSQASARATMATGSV